MGIFGFEAARMPDHVKIAERTIARCPGHRAITGGPHRGTPGRRIVGALVGTNGVEDRMAAAGIEIGADSKHIQRAA